MFVHHPEKLEPIDWALLTERREHVNLLVPMVVIDEPDKPGEVSKKEREGGLEPGIVATELQNHVTDDGALQWLEGAKETMEWLAPQDIAETVGFIATLPPHANVQQVTIMPTRQPS